MYIKFTVPNENKEFVAFFNPDGETNLYKNIHIYSKYISEENLIQFIDNCLVKKNRSDLLNKNYQLKISFFEDEDNNQGGHLLEYINMPDTKYQEVIFDIEIEINENNAFFIHDDNVSILYNSNNNSISNINISGGIMNFNNKSNDKVSGPYRYPKSNERGVGIAQTKKKKNGKVHAKKSKKKIKRYSKKKQIGSSLDYKNTKCRFLPFQKRNRGLTFNGPYELSTINHKKKNEKVTDYFGHKCNYCFICNAMGEKDSRFQFSFFKMSSGRHHCRNCFVSVCDKHFHRNTNDGESLCEICYKYKEYKLFNDFIEIKDSQYEIEKQIKNDNLSSQFKLYSLEKNEEDFISNYPSFFEKKKPNSNVLISSIHRRDVHYPFISKVNLTNNNKISYKTKNLIDYEQWKLIFNLWFENEALWELKKNLRLVKNSRANTNNPIVKKLGLLPNNLVNIIFKK